ncbi:unnamed protein product [Linum trigynum]|uniref:Uncharacterized protein n=1 Tax=Linum trigynum TaxID=586398 RepID=A0AAV2F9S4_9ROSI
MGTNSSMGVNSKKSSTSIKNTKQLPADVVENCAVREASVTSPSGNDEDQFMIKCRSPHADSGHPANSVQVRQVVSAFEEGMIINEDKELLENAEGTCLEDLHDGAAAGRKQFVEDLHECETVEEASLEWPHLVK